MSLRGFRQATMLAVALSAMLLLMFDASLTGAPQADLTSADTTAVEAAADANDRGAEEAEADPQQSLTEATSTIRGLLNGLVRVLPKIAVALLLLLLAWLLSMAMHRLLQRFLRGWEKSEAASAIVRLTLFLLAIGAGLSVIAGDATALVGSVGLVGLALSWALQTPIESFTGFVLNAFRGYYRPGDRIEVGDVYGDVYRIGVLATTVWESGGPGKSVSGAQPTGALITFPNWEILRSNIINYSQDFPFVWDEVVFGVANESDLKYTLDVIRKAATSVVGEMMQTPADQYRELLKRQRLSFDVEKRPQVYVSLTDSWTNFTVRYLVPLRERRKWSSELVLLVSCELARPEHRGRIRPAYPKSKVDVVRNETASEY
jgi:small-conductance mechanosensitive channel